MNWELISGVAALFAIIAGLYAAIRWGGSVLSWGWHTSLQAWFVGLLRSAAVEQSGRVVAARAHVYVSEDDNGQVDVYLTLVNLSRKPLEVEQLFLQQFLASGSQLPGASPALTPLLEPILPGRGVEVHFRATLGAPAIRQLIRSVEKAQNLRSSPRIQFVFVGSLEVQVGKRRGRIQFSIGTTTPDLNLSCPTAARD